MKKILSVVIIVLLSFGLFGMSAHAQSTGGGWHPGGVHSVGGHPAWWFHGHGRWPPRRWTLGWWMTAEGAMGGDPGFIGKVQ